MTDAETQSLLDQLAAIGINEDTGLDLDGS
jgi:hypothetical protein